MADFSKFKLGRKAIKTDSRTLMLADYLTPSLPPPPPTADWTKGITAWGMMLNDTLGDCTIAGCGHAVQVWTANAGSEVTIPDATIEKFYETWDGYKPGDPSTDNGGVELDVLNDWKKQGFAGHALTAFVDPRPASLTQVRQSIALFGGVYIAACDGAKAGRLGCGAERRLQCPAWQLGRPLCVRAQIRSERLYLHHLGTTEDHDPGLLERVLRRGTHPAQSGLAGCQRLARRLRSGAVAGRPEGDCLASQLPLHSSARQNRASQRTNPGTRLPLNWF